MIFSVEPIPIKGRMYLGLFAELPEHPAVAALAFYWPGVGWTPTAFTVYTGLRIDLGGVGDPAQVPFDPPYEIEAPCSPEALTSALQRFQQHARQYMEG